MRNNLLCSSILVAVLLSACNNSPVSKSLTFSPSSLTNCEVGSEVLVKWDVKSEHPNVSDVQIFVSTGGSETLFAEGTAIGESKTGPWVRPGDPIFIAKDKISHKELGRAFVSGPVCK